MNYLIQKHNLSLNEVAYIGDDINDLECLQSVGVSAMPQSSPILHRFKSDIITNLMCPLIYARYKSNIPVINPIFPLQIRSVFSMLQNY